MKEQKPNKKEVRVTFRLYNDDDIIRFEKLKKESIATGESISLIISNILRDYLLEKDKKALYRNLRDDIFYAFQKSFYASMTPFSANIIKEVLRNRVEDTLMNKKIDILLNTLAEKDQLNENQLKAPSAKILEESSYFEKIRELFNIENKSKMAKIDQKIKAVKDQQRAFEEYDNHFDEIDPKISAKVYEFDEEEFKDDEK